VLTYFITFSPTSYLEECLFDTSEALNGNDVPHGADFTLAEMYMPSWAS
jgi:hypothetical protein